MIDDLDREILARLRVNSRAPLAALARDLHVNRATVSARIDRLAATGVIEAFTIRLTDEVDRDSIRGVVLVASEPARGQDIVRGIRGLPEVEELHSTLGVWDLVVHLRASSMERFDDALERIRALPGVTRTETSLLFNSLTRDH
ncbi:Lrp/AsnC family transcriptional regulator [Microbacterium sp. NPDC086615]|uniref:Lrp/AsnC family transcriptional regulator n=1 Tax=Microbacterium sp. NPDC086615 TaxID=3154865 RepID=UPI00341F1A77|nr:AsnC family transcriptional regulator [Microbacterium sp.]